jgi:hypothetical protein
MSDGRQLADTIKDTPYETCQVEVFANEQKIALEDEELNARILGFYVDMATAEPDEELVVEEIGDDREKVTICTGFASMEEDVNLLDEEINKAIEIITRLTRIGVTTIIFRSEYFRNPMVVKLAEAQEIFLDIKIHRGKALWREDEEGEKTVN